MGRKAKLGTLQGVAAWEKLDSPGDIKRFLRWCILSVRDQTLDARIANTLGLLGCYQLKAMEAEVLHDRLADLERRIEQSEHRQGTPQLYESGNSTTTH